MTEQEERKLKNENGSLKAICLVLFIGCVCLYFFEDAIKEREHKMEIAAGVQLEEAYSKLESCDSLNLHLVASHDRTCEQLDSAMILIHRYEKMYE